MVPTPSDTGTDKGRHEVCKVARWRVDSFGMITSAPFLFVLNCLITADFMIYSIFKGFNANFLVKVTDRDCSRGRLVGVRGFVALVGDIALAERIFTSAYNSRGDKFTRRLRRGLTITFYAR